MKHKTAKLEGALLDAAVAKAIGEYRIGMFDPKIAPWPAYSADWRAAGAIIEREGISVWQYHDNQLSQSDAYAGWWAAVDGVWGWDSGDVCAEEQAGGPSPLIAAMRAYVASKFGDEVEFP